MRHVTSRLNPFLVLGHCVAKASAFMAPILGERTCYTIGTWRVGLNAYLQQLHAFAVQRIVDVRGNPQAGRQEELKRSKAFERALAGVGVRYEYWGRELGESAVEAGTTASTLEELCEIAKSETVCLLGHLHEPSGCHRLQLCEALAASGLQVQHLLWKDHREVKALCHQEVAAETSEVLRFFREHKLRAEGERSARGAVAAPGPQLETVEWKNFRQEMFSDGQSYRLRLPFDTELLWYPQWLTPEGADVLQGTVEENITFYHPTYVFQQPEGGFAKTLIKRGQARVCDKICPGSMGSTTLQAWSEKLLRQVEDAADAVFNCFVANHYADGRVVINWHSDSGPGDDEGLGPNPTIGSISLGARRNFALKSKRPLNGRIVHVDIPLTHGSLLVMGNNSQTHWLHALPAEDSVSQERINLTFRFYARQSTRHIEGVEHNHEWETAAEALRVRLHRDALGAGRPVLVDVPLDLAVHQLPRYLTPVLPGWRRGPVDVSAYGKDGWGSPLAADAMAAHSELRLLPRSAQRRAAPHGQTSDPKSTARDQDGQRRDRRVQEFRGKGGRGSKGRGRGA